MANTAAGWYQDPYDPTRVRWWDGRTWTAATSATPPMPQTMQPASWASAGFASASPPTPPPSTSTPSTSTPPTSTPPKRPLTRSAKTTIWIVAVVLFLIVVRGGLGGLLIMAGIAALVIGAIAVANGKLDRLRIRTRGTAGVVLAAGMALTLVGGIAVGATAAPAPQRPVSLVAEADTSGGGGTGPSATPTPRASSASTATVEVVTEVTAIPFTRTTVEDPAIDVGTTVVSTAGVDGKQSTSYRVMKRDGVETARVVASKTVIQQPVAEVTSVGTRQPPPPPEPVAEPQPAPVAGGGGAGCDPNYDWVCVPIASDVDCAGGSGNGPAYVQGPVHVIGRDIYDLDRDGDGIGCD